MATDDCIQRLNALALRVSSAGRFSDSSGEALTKQYIAKFWSGDSPSSSEAESQSNDAQSETTTTPDASGSHGDGAEIEAIDEVESEDVGVLIESEDVEVGIEAIDEVKSEDVEGIKSEDVDEVKSEDVAEVKSEDEEDAEIERIDVATYAAGAHLRESEDYEEELGELEGLPKFGRDYFAVPVRAGEGEVEGQTEHIPVSDYLGDEWVQEIHKLHAVQSMEIPPHMTDNPHPWQLKGAAQADHMCRSRFRGIIIGDRPGLGKTLLAILAMWLCKDEPGINVVVCPSSLCVQWAQAIEDAWSEDHGMTALILDDPSMTAHEIHARGYDVLVCSYEFVEHGARRTLRMNLDLAAWERRGERRPERVTTALSSSFWKELDMRIKRLVIDEAQNVNKRDGKRHLALKDLDALAVIMLSGTMAHNKWHDVSGLVDFLRSHPLTTHYDFKKMFTSTGPDGRMTENPDPPRMRMLQRFLQAFVIARPSSLLTLPPCKPYAVITGLHHGESALIDFFTGNYKRGAAINKKTDAIDVDNCSFMTWAIRAQLRAIHPLLERSMKVTPKEVLFDDGGGDKLGALGDGDPDADYEPGADEGFEPALHGQEVINALNDYDDSDVQKVQKRAEWLEQVEEYVELLEESPRLQGICRLVQRLRHERPLDKLVIFSQYLKALDLVDEGLYRITGQRSLRFDGHLDRKHRSAHLRDFQNPLDTRPLLNSARAGGTGLNLTCANIVIQVEVWWNKNEEAQALDRVHRQLQEKVVRYYRFESASCAIDTEVKRVQLMKTDVNGELMEPLVRRHDEGPDIRQMLHFPPVELSDNEGSSDVVEEDIIDDMMEEDIIDDMMDVEEDIMMED